MPKEQFTRLREHEVRHRRDGKWRGSAGTTGAELSREAIRQGRLLADLLPEPEVMGLLGLMLLQESRRAARSSPEGDLILLDQQDRSLWNRDMLLPKYLFSLRRPR